MTWVVIDLYTFRAALPNTTALLIPRRRRPYEVQCPSKQMTVIILSAVPALRVLRLESDAKFTLTAHHDRGGDDFIFRARPDCRPPVGLCLHSMVYKIQLDTLLQI